MKTLIFLLLIGPSLVFGECVIPTVAKAPELISLHKTTEGRRQNWNLQAQDHLGVFQIKLTVYSAKNNRGHNLILFPTIDGESILERQTAAYFARKGYLVMIPTIEEVRVAFGERTTCAMDQTYRRVQESALLLEQLLEESRPGKKLMLAGASQGGIRSIMSAAVLPRAHAVWSIVAGGDFPSIYSESRVIAITAFREQHMSALNFTQPRVYEEYLRQNLIFDPELSCGDIQAKLALVVATEDESVPTLNQERLVERCQPQKVRRIKAGHIRGAADLFLKRITMRKFFESK